MNDPRAWIRLTTGFATHPKTLQLSDRAFRALINLWCYAGQQETDGFLTEKSVKIYAKPKDLRELFDLNFLEKTDKKDVFYLHDWAEHQTSKEARTEAAKRAQSSRRQAGTQTAHERWHVGRGIKKEGCDLCDDLYRSPIGKKIAPDRS